MAPEKPVRIMLPVFPLPNTVLFPHGTLPLHVFEKRYLKMLDDLAGDPHREGLIAMGLFKEGWEKDYRDTLSIYDVFGVAKLVAYEENDDGTRNVLLSGYCRGRLVEWFDEKSYREAEVELLPESSSEDRKAAEREKKILLKRVYMLGKFAVNLDGFLRLKELIKLHGSELGALADVLADVFLREGRLRQEIMSALDPMDRSRVLRASLSRSFDRILGRISPAELAGPDEFSVN